jgi:hypothetical protein
LFIFEKKQIGEEVYYRLVCSHAGREIKEWLPLATIGKNHREMVDKYEQRCKAISHLPLLTQENEEKILDCTVNGNRIIYKFQDRQGVIVEVDSNFFIIFQKLPPLLHFLESQTYE